MQAKMSKPLMCAQTPSELHTTTEETTFLWPSTRLYASQGVRIKHERKKNVRETQFAKDILYSQFISVPGMLSAFASWTWLISWQTQ